MPDGDGLGELRRHGYTVVQDVLPEEHLVSGANGVFLVGRAETITLKEHAATLQTELGCRVTPVSCEGARTFRHNGVLIAGEGELADAIRSCPPQRRTSPDRLARYAHSLKV
jgi:hypothetical protein